MIGTNISHYKILEKLGEGGMGVVYKARDTKLDREVALKFLPHNVSSSDVDRARFLQEAKAAAILNHPNVCTIYDIQQSDDQQFIVMEYVEGLTIKQKFTRSPLRINDAVGYAIQIGEALEEAHAKGIVHRDIKSENIMINAKDQIKVMDFGLAKLRGSVKLTKSSSTTGTLAYMAPEQIQGADPDARSDIFSFGVVLYEMLAGQTPFRGEHEAAMMYSIVNEEPQPIQKFRDDISPEMMHVLNRALEKIPEERYQTVKEMTIDLRRLRRDTTRVVRTLESGTDRGTSSHALPKKARSYAVKLSLGLGLTLAVAFFYVLRNGLAPEPTGKAGPKMIVVLPFENLGPGEKDYFVDGMTDEVTSRLSGLSGLGVIARSSAIQYKKTTKSFKQIAEELGVQYVLQGTVRWEDIDGETHVRINPSLIKVEDGTQTWSQSIESVLSGAFKLQADIATRVASALDLVLVKSEQQTLQTTLTDSPQAYDYYMQAIVYSRSESESDMRIGVQLLERATEIDPAFAAAYAKLSYIHSNIYWYYYDRSEASVKQSQAAAEKAVQLAPQLSESHEAMGWYYYHCLLDYTHALEQFDIALELRPSNSDVNYGTAAVLRRKGDMKRSAEFFKKAVTGNPRSSDIIRQLGETLALMRDYEGAEKQYDRAISLAPDDREAYLNKVENVLLWNGDLRAATRFIEQAHRYGKVGIDSERPYFFSYIVASIANDYTEAESALNEMDRSKGFSDQFQYYPVHLLRAQLEEQRGNQDLSLIYYDSARVLLEMEIKTRPQDERVHSALGLTYAGLGRAEDAINAGQRAVELLPVEKEAWRGAYRLIDLAVIYARIGEDKKAIDLIEHLLEIPCPLSVELLKIDHDWDRLRNNPRFQKLIAP